MSSRTAATLACVLALTGCRDLVQPGEAPPVPLELAGLLLDPAGQPLVGASVFVFNDRFRDGNPRVTWEGLTDARGRFRPELMGEAIVDVRVRPDPATTLPEQYTFMRQAFSDEQTLVLRLPLERFTGHVSWAEAEPLDLSYVTLRFQFSDDGWFQSLELRANGTGYVDGWLRPGESYEITATASYSGYSLQYVWPEEAVIGSGESLDFTIPDVGFDIVATLGGNAFSFSLLQVAVEGLSGRLRLRQTFPAAGMGPVRAYGFPAVSVVQLQPVGDAPFLEQTYYVDLSQPDVSLTVELGQHLLEVHVLDGAGLPRSGAQVRFVGDSGRSQLVSAGFDGTASMFLQEGRYLVEARPGSGGSFETSVPVTITGDRVLTLVLD